jgi:hypothetical protein
VGKACFPVSRRGRVAILVLLSLISLCRVESRAQARSESEVKAAFLYNFAKFVDWPPEVFPHEDSALKICVLGQNPFGPEFGAFIEGKAAQGRKLQFAQVQNVQQAKSCQILYVASSEKPQILQILKAVDGGRVLTVGDWNEFARSGGIINFVLENDRVRFEINVDAAERSGVKLSSKLLGVASIVRDKPEAARN